MNPLANLRNVVIALALGLMVGFGAGFYTKSRFVKADQIDAVTAAQRQTAKGIEQSLKQSEAVEAKVTASAQNIDAIRKEVSVRIKTKESGNATTFSLGHSCDSWNLDIGTVRLLNSARSNAAPDAASQGDAASQAPSGIGAAEFIDNDLQVVERYQELAINHDALVDYVESLIEKQAE